MRKVIVILVTLLTVSLVTQAQLRFGVRAGVGFPNMTTTVGNAKTTMSRNIGFHAGLLAMYQMPLSFGAFELEGDLQFAKLGARTQESTSKLSLYYIQIPVRANILLDLGFAGVVAGIGPQFGFGLFGSSVLGTKENKIKTDIKFGANDAIYNVLDIALSMHAGFRLNTIPLQATSFYDLGLMDIDKGNTTKTTNHNLGISLAYLF